MFDIFQSILFTQVDFTPIFLSLLPIFLVLGTLLGLAASGLTSSTSLVTSATNGTATTVNVDVNSSSTGGTGGGTNTNTNTSVLPIFVFNNGTNSFVSFFPFALGNIGFGNIFGFNQFPIIFGRTFTSAFEAIIQFLSDLILMIVDYAEEDEDGDYVYMEPDG